MALLKAGSDPYPTKITSFYQVAENITKLTHEIKEYHKIVLAAEEQQKEWNIIVSISPLFNQHLVNAEHNAEKFPKQRRDKKICYILLYLSVVDL